MDEVGYGGGYAATDEWSGTMAPVPIYTCDRRYEVWRWGVGHAGLLLRSNPSREGQARIEVLFKPAYAVCLPSLLDGLTVEESQAGGLPDQAAAAIGREIREWEHYYTVMSGSASGWVLGGSVSGRQGQESHAAPTMFDGAARANGVVQLFEVNVQ